MCFSSLPSLSYLFNSIQHALASLPRFGGLPDAAQTGHAVPLPILQFSVKGVGQQQHGIIDVAVGDLQRKRRRIEKGGEHYNNNNTISTKHILLLRMIIEVYISQCRDLKQKNGTIRRSFKC